MIYRSGQRLLPHHVRAATFDVRQRGLDPDQVYDFLQQVADELDRLSRDLTTATTEAERIRQAVRQWQPGLSGCRVSRPWQAPNGRWPR
ncbi:DivIVA domain-containing protein [Micromonospora matsumotoense]|uniref:DivIVA domain-containing protein n=1 Tax=Micromonospora matsumotoense TaxID=121616 RepID=UPI00342EE437